MKTTYSDFLYVEETNQTYVAVWGWTRKRGVFLINPTPEEAERLKVDPYGLLVEDEDEPLPMFGDDGEPDQGDEDSDYEGAAGDEPDPLMEEYRKALAEYKKPQSTVLSKTVGDTHYTIYDSIGAMANELDDVVWKNRMMTLMSRQDTQVRYFGRHFDSKEHLRAAVDQMWKEGVDLINRLINRLHDIELPELKSHARRIRFNPEDGDELDLDRLRGGQDYWRESKREETHGPTEVTLIADMGISWTRKPEEVMWKGAAAIVLTEFLEARGYRVELWTIHSGQYDFHEKRLIQAVRLKTASDPLVMSSIAQAVSAWFTRGIAFGVGIKEHKQATGDWPSMLASMFKSIHPRHLDVLSQDQHRYYFSDVYSEDGAVQLIEHFIEKIGDNR